MIAYSDSRFFVLHLNVVVGFVLNFWSSKFRVVVCAFADHVSWCEIFVSFSNNLMDYAVTWQKRGCIKWSIKSPIRVLRIRYECVCVFYDCINVKKCEICLVSHPFVSSLSGSFTPMLETI